MLEIAEPEPAKFLLDGDAVQPKLAHLRPQRARETVLRVDLRRDRRDLVGGEAPRACRGSSPPFSPRSKSRPGPCRHRLPLRSPPSRARRDLDKARRAPMCSCTTSVRPERSRRAPAKPWCIRPSTSLRTNGLWSIIVNHRPDRHPVHARTPMGAIQGALSDATATQLGATAVSAAVERSGVSRDEIDQIFMGCVLPAGLGQAPARQAAIEAGLPAIGRGDHRQQGLRIGHADGDHGRTTCSPRATPTSSSPAAWRA